MVYYIMFLGTHEPFSKNRLKHSKKLWHCQKMVLIYRSYRWDNSQVNTSKKLLKSCWQEVRLVLIYRSCHVVTTSTLKTKQRHTKNVRVIEETWWTTNNSAADKLGKKQASKEMSQVDLWIFFMRVWSWLRTNAGGVPNTCKSNEPRPSACTWSRWVANGWVTRG